MLPWLASTATSSAAFWAGATSTTWSTPPGRDLEDRLGEVVVGVAEHVVRARGARELPLLLAADRGDDGGARPGRELDRGVPDGPRTALHQHDAAARGRPATRRVGPELVHGERAVRGHRGDAEARGDVEADAVGQAHDAVGGHDGELLGGAGGALVGGEEQPDAVADSQPVDALADGVDDAGAVLVRHHLPERQGRPAAARAFQSVGFTPETATRTRTSPAPGVAARGRRAVRTEESPGRE